MAGGGGHCYAALCNEAALNALRTNLQRGYRPGNLEALQKVRLFFWRRRFSVSKVAPKILGSL
jgi:hypothetical protein